MSGRPAPYCNDGQITLHQGDCRELLPQLAAASVDSVVTDPPYGLQFLDHGWDRLWRNLTAADRAYVERTQGQLTGRARSLPDYTLTDPQQVQAWHQRWAAATLPLLKPGGYLLAFGGTRTYHRLVCALEDAGFEIRDCLTWLYGQGFPKRRGLLKPGFEPIVLAQRPLSEGSAARNLERWGTGPLNIDACRIPLAGIEPHLTPGAGKVGYQGGWSGVMTTPHLVRYDSQGRWPANVVLDEPAAALLDVQSRERSSSWSGPRRGGRRGGMFGASAGAPAGDCYADHGGASRFFYCPKADRDERDAGLNEGGRVSGSAQAAPPVSNHHPTVKPLALMQWLVRLVTPPGGLVLDPFLGSGTTACACVAEGRRCVGIEQDAGYLAIARQRLTAIQRPLPLEVPRCP